jgi:hypothetical protein
MMLRRLKEVEMVCKGKRAKTGGSFSEKERVSGDAFNRAESQT